MTRLNECSDLQRCPAIKLPTVLAAAVATFVCVPPVMAGDSGRLAAGDRVGVLLSSAFTLQGYWAPAADCLFSEYVLHAARPEQGLAVAIAEWVTPVEEALPLRVDDTAVASAVSILPPKRPGLIFPTAGLRKSADPAVAISASSSAASLLDLRPMAMIRRWASAVPILNLRPAHQKVAGLISSLGDRVSGLVPRL